VLAFNKKNSKTCVTLCLLGTIYGINPLLLIPLVSPCSGLLKWLGLERGTAQTTERAKNETFSPAKDAKTKLFCGHAHCIFTSVVCNRLLVVFCRFVNKLIGLENTFYSIYKQLTTYLGT
jgi:hypothetical protein